MCRDLRALVLGCAVVLAARSAGADESRGGWLVTSRSDSAQECPSTEELAGATEALLENPPPRATPLLRVDFDQREGRFTAKLARLDVTTGARELRDDHPDCETLAQAVVTALALMLDTRELPLPAAAPERSPAQAVAPAKAPEPSALEPRSAHAFGIELQGGAALGVVEKGELAPYVEAGLVLESGAFRASLGALWLPRRRVELGPGYVDAELLAISSRACLRLFDLALDLFACTGVFGGALAAEAHGYTADYDERRPWLALPVELALAGPISESADFRAGYRLGATLLVPARRQSFSVQGLGTAIEPARVALLLWLGLDNELLW